MDFKLKTKKHHWYPCHHFTPTSHICYHMLLNYAAFTTSHTLVIRGPEYFHVRSPLLQTHQWHDRRFPTAAASMGAPLIWIGRQGTVTAHP